jgi:Holliday junction DNA helicase RuvB
VSGKPKAEDINLDSSLRPRRFDDFIGQEKIKQNLEIAITAAKGRGEALDHVLLYGPPGLGKTTLAYIIAAEMEVNIRVTSDEIHRLSRAVEEVLYLAMEDFALDIIIGKGPGARSLRLNLPAFTLIGATTRFGLLSPPLRDRFGVIYRLDFYDQASIEKILHRSARILQVKAEAGGLGEIARRARGTPRVANRLLKRVRDYAQVMADGVATKEVAVEALSKLEVDQIGLDEIDHKVLETIISKFNGGPVGLDTIAASISEEADTITDVYEPYLLQLGFLERTPRGRLATPLAYEHLGLPYNKKPPQPNLL